MRWSFAPRALTQRPPDMSAADTRLRGIWLALARLTWVALAGLALLQFGAGIPARYVDLLTTNGQDRSTWTAAAYHAALAQLGLSPSFVAAYNVALAVAVAMGSCAVAAVIVRRRSDDWLALFISLFLLTLGTGLTGITPALVQSQTPWRVPFQIEMAFIDVSFPLFCAIFPDGRFVPRWTRLLALIWIPAMLYEIFNPDDPIKTRDTVGLLLLVGGVITGVCAQIYRYRRVSGPIQRQQAKWVAIAVAALLLEVTILANLVPVLFPLLMQPSVPGVLYQLAGPLILFPTLLLIPFSIGIAVLRYRLFDIDLIINRALVYGTLTANIVGVYVLVVGALSMLFRTYGNALIAFLATGVVAVLVHPLRERLQRGVNHLLYGQRDEPYAVLARLGQRLRATLAPEAVLPTIVETIAQALKLPYAAVGLKQGEEVRIAAAYGLLVGTPLSLPLAYQGEVIGQLLMTPRRPGEPLTPPDRRLLEDLTHQIGVAAHAIRLTDDLQRSRVQLVTAREEERRRLRRDLHDGLGPTLAALALKATTIGDLIPTDAAAATQLSDELYADIRATVGEIRRLVYALRPPALDELGLVAALRESAAHYARPDRVSFPSDRVDGLCISVEAPEHLPPLPAAVEVAAYRIVQEALTNVVRHAQAHTCTVRVVLAENLQIEVGDDGTGLPAERPAGVGLLSMRERAAELGGTCVIESFPGAGVRIHARLPLPKEQADGALAHPDRG